MRLVDPEVIAMMAILLAHTIPLPLQRLGMVRTDTRYLTDFGGKCPRFRQILREEMRGTGASLRRDCFRKENRRLDATVDDCDEFAALPGRQQLRKQEQIGLMAAYGLGFRMGLHPLANFGSDRSKDRRIGLFIDRLAPQ